MPVYLWRQQGDLDSSAAEFAEFFRIEAQIGVHQRGSAVGRGGPLHRPWWLLTLPVVAGISGCSTRGLAFVHDDRVAVVAPLDQATVDLPLTVRWTARDLPPGAAFGVAVDVAPPRPGRAPGTDDQVVRTARTHVTLDHVGSTTRAGGQGTHQITVFLVDGRGERLGESAWRVDVRLADHG
jgi:hypothetical protein